MRFAQLAGNFSEILLRRQIPSLVALEAFDAVSRLGSTTKAADELGRTQSAISRQISILETAAGQRLFDRSASGLHLTATGRALYEPANAALNLIDRAMARTRAGTADVKRLQLLVWPTFGSRWLSSRLLSYPREKVGVEIEILLGLGPGEEQLRSFKTDAVIMVGAGDWPGIVSYPLVAEDLILVGAPQLFDRSFDLFDHNWLHFKALPGTWKRWLRAHDLEEASVKPGNQYDAAMLIELATLGMGLAVLPSIYVERELASGQLIAPLGDVISTGRSYYLCYLEQDAGRSEFVAFREWMLSTRDH